MEWYAALSLAIGITGGWFYWRVFEELSPWARRRQALAFTLSIVVYWPAVLVLLWVLYGPRIHLPHVSLKVGVTAMRSLVCVSFLALVAGLAAIAQACPKKCDQQPVPPAPANATAADFVQPVAPADSTATATAAGSSSATAQAHSAQSAVASPAQSAAANVIVPPANSRSLEINRTSNRGGLKARVAEFQANRAQSKATRANNRAATANAKAASSAATAAAANVASSQVRSSRFSRTVTVNRSSAASVPVPVPPVPVPAASSPGGGAKASASAQTY